MSQGNEELKQAKEELEKMVTLLHPVKHAIEISRLEEMIKKIDRQIMWNTGRAKP